MRKTNACVIAVGLVVLLLTTGCKSPKGNPRPPRKEAAEYNCLHHAKDGICEVPVNGKTVLYCVKGPWKRTVRYREDCK